MKGYQKAAWLLCAGAIPFCMWQNGSLTVSEVSVRSKRVPRAFDGYRILQISDLHGRRFGPGQKRMLNLIKSLAPDRVAFTGDLVDRSQKEASPVLELLDGLNRLSLPMDYAPGNHEAHHSLYGWLRPLLERGGVTILDDGEDCLNRGNEVISILGVKDRSFEPRSFDQKAAGEHFAARLRDVCFRSEAGNGGKRPFTVLLSHRPEYAPLYQSLRFDVVLCGHAHGGQVRLPGIGGLFAPGQGILPSYTSGLYRLGQTAMIVSRGLGNSSHARQRMFNRPELVVITLKNSDSTNG